jgi:hypothetical protein
VSTVTDERLYDLLPAVLRIRDVEPGEPLRALLAVLEGQFRAVEEDIAQLYDNWFVETCEDWLVPYIGDLLAVRGMHAVSERTATPRVVVANTLSYRRRKGTATMLEQLARDTTGWPARAVEFFELVAATQNVNHVRPENLATADLHGAARLEHVDGPFERVPRTVEVRSIARRGGRYNIANVGLFLWRLQSYPLTQVTARAFEPADGRFRLGPLALDTPLFNQPESETDVAHLAEEINVPHPLRRRALIDTADQLAGERPLLRIEADGTPVDPQRIVVCDLTEPAPSLAAGKVAVDPELGRLAFPTGQTPTAVLVDYVYGFSGDLGGGPYDRTDSANAALSEPATWQIGVSQSEPPAAGVIVATLSEAVSAWNAQPAGTRGVIAILDSRTYTESLTGGGRILVPDGSELLVIAAGWPAEDRQPGRFVASGRRPHLLGSIEVRGLPATGAPGRVAFNGLLVEGSVTATPGDLGHLLLAHSTLVPRKGGLLIEASAGDGENDRLALRIDRCVCASITVQARARTVTLVDSVLAESGGKSLAAAGTAAALEGCTVLGASEVKSLDASNSIFMDAVAAARRQMGCVRFSYLPPESTTPRRYRCQPDLAVVTGTGPPERLRPTFTTLVHGQPGYAQLSRACAGEIRAGADDGSEMGAFGFLKQPQREANLLASLDEYLRLGLEAGLFYVT